MHQSLVVLSQRRKTFSNRGGKNLILSGPFSCSITASARGCILINHCLESIGSTIEFEREECPTEWVMSSIFSKLPSSLILSTSFSRQSYRSKPQKTPERLFIVPSLLMQIGAF